MIDCLCVKKSYLRMNRDLLLDMRGLREIAMKAEAKSKVAFLHMLMISVLCTKKAGARQGS